MDFASEERLTVVDHPLIKHKLSVIRNEDTPDYLFHAAGRAEKLSDDCRTCRVARGSF